MTQVTIRAYRRDDKGLLKIVSATVDEDALYYGDGIPEPTGETTVLQGWPDEGKARVYRSTCGDLIVPLATLQKHGLDLHITPEEEWS